MGSPDQTIAQARALAYQAVDLLRRANELLSQAEHLRPGTGFAVALHKAGGDIEDAESVIVDVAYALEEERRRGTPPAGDLTRRFLGDETPGEPEPMGLAILVDALDDGGRAGWERAVAADALLWLLRKNERASAILRDLAAGNDDPQAGTFSDEARKRP